jgi:predicted metal-dependent phosphotriesterase family hydrolase
MRSNRSYLYLRIQFLGVGGNFIGCTRLFDKLLPCLKNSGFTESEIEQMMGLNPRNTFAYGIRKVKQ